MASKGLVFVAVVGLVAGLTGAVWADSVRSFGFCDGSRAARATFSQSGSGLIVTLENTAGTHAASPEDVLTAVYFDLNAEGVTVTPLSAVLSEGSKVLYDSDSHPAELGGEFGFRSDVATAWPDGFYGHPAPHMVISAVGLGDYLGRGDLFPPGTPLTEPPKVPNGIDFGLVNPGYDGSGNSKVSGGGNCPALIDHSVTFTLEVTGPFEPGDIDNVWFNYGTDFNPIPEPLTILAVFLGVAGLGAYIRRRRIG